MISTDLLSPKDVVLLSAIEFPDNPVDFAACRILRYDMSYDEYMMALHQCQIEGLGIIWLGDKLRITDDGIQRAQRVKQRVRKDE